LLTFAPRSDNLTINREIRQNKKVALVGGRTMAATNQRKPISAVLLLLSLLTSPLLAKLVTVDQVKKVANTFLKAENGRTEKQLKTFATKEIQKESPKEFTIAGVKEIRSYGKVVAYVTELQPEGFIITAADTDIRPILGPIQA
jgi:hypothetical protein